MEILLRQSLVSLFIVTTRPSASKRCQRRLQPASCLALLMSSLMMTLLTFARYCVSCLVLHNIKRSILTLFSLSPSFNSQPGDRVQIIGNYRCLPSKRSGYTTGTFRTVLLATNVITLSKEVAPLFSARDVAKIKRFSRSKQYDPFEMLAHSLAPSIHGHDYIKKAVLCMLLGGVEKILENGTRLRGWV